jgi:predicted DNA-binding protein with PD1-like motif
MNPLPLRLHPGDDLRGALQQAVAAAAPDGAFVLAGIGSLVDAQLRLAGQPHATRYPGPSEILTLSGTVSADGAHLHVSIATADGQVHGGHLVAGNTVRTTAEVLLAPMDGGWRLGRAPDPATGYPELIVRRIDADEPMSRRSPPSPDASP